MRVAAIFGAWRQRRGLKLMVLIWTLRLTVVIAGLMLQRHRLARPPVMDFDPGLMASTPQDRPSGESHPDFRGDIALPPDRPTTSAP